MNHYTVAVLPPEDVHEGG